MYFKIKPLLVGVFPSFERSTFLLGVEFGTKMKAPCIAWLLEGENGEKILVDTGPHLTDSPSARFHSKIDCSESQRIDQVLIAEGVDPLEIKKVVFTHLHWDHCHHCDYLKNASFTVQKKEADYAANPIEWHRGSYESGLEGIQAPWSSVQDRLQIVDGDVEITPGIHMIHLPGHTPGCAGLTVNTRKGTFVIAGDAVPLLENWEGIGSRRHIPSALMTDIFQYYQSFEKLEEIGGIVLPAHDFRTFDCKTWG